MRRKNLVAIVLAVAFAVPLAGCSSDAENTDTSQIEAVDESVEDTDGMTERERRVAERREERRGYVWLPMGIIAGGLALYGVGSHRKKVADAEKKPEGDAATD